MGRGRVALVWVVPALGALAACAQEGDGGIAAFASYEVDAQLVDQPNLNGPGFYRELDFSFSSNAKTRSACASFGKATATFAGKPIEISIPGGWTTSSIPTNTKPGETVSFTSCDEPFISLTFDATADEPQNGVLAFDGSGKHLEVTFHQDVGSPSITLVSATGSTLVVGLQGFVVPPELAHVSVMLLAPTSSGAGTAVVLPSSGLSADGQLTAVVPPGTFTRATSTTVTVDVNLGSEVLVCEGFARCMGMSHLYRNLDVDFPAP